MKSIAEASFHPFSAVHVSALEKCPVSPSELCRSIAYGSAGVRTQDLLPCEGDVITTTLRNQDGEYVAASL